jgi:hypothetical protein
MTSPVSEIFDIRYGHSLELNALKRASAHNGIAFVSRQTGANGISAYVAPVEGLEPAPAGELSCALSGNGVLTTCLQESPFYTGYHVAILKPKMDLTREQLLFYCLCIRANRYRYSYGRQANKTLGRLLIPSVDEIPPWVSKVDLGQFEGADAALSTEGPLKFNASGWKPFVYRDLFKIDRGLGPRKSTLTSKGETPFITSTDKNNGLTGYTEEAPCHDGNVITVNRNGSVGEAYYQPFPFSTTEDVHVFNPKFPLNQYVALFLVALIRRERYRFGYGRKWGLGRMNESIIRLPATGTGEPDWAFMESYIKSLPYSKSI